MQQPPDLPTEGARKAADPLADRAAAAVERARTTGDEWLESCRQSVRERPLTTVGIALAVGYLLARLIDAR